MKVKDSFIKRVLHEGRVITAEYLYFIEIFKSPMQGEVFCVYRTKNVNTYYYQNKLSVTSFQVVGCYDINGNRI